MQISLVFDTPNVYFAMLCLFTYFTITRVSEAARFGTTPAPVTTPVPIQNVKIWRNEHFSKLVLNCLIPIKFRDH